MDPITIMTTAATPIIQSLVKDVFVPKFKSFIKPLYDEIDGLLNQHEAYFYFYLNRMYEKNIIVNSKAIPNSQLRLDKVYVAQTLVLDRDSRFELDADEVTIKVDSIPVDSIKEYKKILIKDPVGMGKSTIMKYMFINLIESHIIDLGVPIYIELSQLTDTNTIIKKIHNEVSSLSEEFDDDKLFRFIQNGGFIFFLDGYDEIPSCHKAAVTKDIQAFISKASNAIDNYFILTSRSEEWLNAFGEFQKFRIRPLTKVETFDLLSKYDLSKDKKDSIALIEELKTGKYKSIDDCLKNPLLVSMLLYIFKNQKDSTLDLHSFYREIIDTFFYGQDISKGIVPHKISSELSYDDLDQVLRFIGYMCLISEKDAFDKDDILGYIRNIKNNCRKTVFNESDCLNDLLLAVPFFYEQGAKCKWVYRSLMDYFAARYIALDAKENQDEILRRIYQSKHICHYINLLNIYFDVDNLGFTKNITKSLCGRFINFCSSNKVNLNIKSSIVENRLGLLFHFDQTKLAIVKNNMSSLIEKEEKKTDVNEPQLTIGPCKHLSSSHDAYLFTKVNNNHYILMVLYEKMPSLYAEISIGQPFDNLKNALYEYEIKEFHDIECLKDVNVRTGYKHEDVYSFVNELLIESKKSDPLILPLNYKSCLSEIENIKQRTDQSIDNKYPLPM